MADNEPNNPAADGAAIAEQLNATTSEDAGGNVSGTGGKDTDLDIVFEPEAEPTKDAGEPSPSRSH